MTKTEVSEETRTAFQILARGNGAAIEEVIAEVYRALAEDWPAPLIVVDGGANVGYHTKRMANVPNISKVIAIEANPQTYESHVRANTNAPHFAKVSLVQAAIQDDPFATSIKFTMSLSHPGRSGINPIMALNDKTTTFEEPIVVAATTIDKLTAGQGKCGFIKLDLEGTEFAALRGARQTLLRDTPVCVFENGGQAPALGGYTLEDFIAYIRSVGMTLMTVYGDEFSVRNARDFWYAWAVPTNRFEEVRAVIVDKLQARMATEPA